MSIYIGQLPFVIPKGCVKIPWPGKLPCTPVSVCKIRSTLGQTLTHDPADPVSSGSRLSQGYCSRTNLSKANYSHFISHFQGIIPIACYRDVIVGISYMQTYQKAVKYMTSTARPFKRFV